MTIAYRQNDQEEEEDAEESEGVVEKKGTYGVCRIALGIDHRDHDISGHSTICLIRNTRITSDPHLLMTIGSLAKLEGGGTESAGARISQRCPHAKGKKKKRCAMKFRLVPATSHQNAAALVDSSALLVLYIDSSAFLVVMC